MSTFAARRPASPYARKLARERGLPLAAITGSGPDGRIVAADVLRWSAADEPPTVRQGGSMADRLVSSSPEYAVSLPAAAVLAAPRSIGAFETRADLGPLAALIAASGSGLATGPFIAKAAARGAGPLGDRILLVDGAGRSGVVVGAASLTPGVIGKALEAGTGGATAMEVVLLAGEGIRPISAGLAADFQLKLVVVASADAAALLLVHDEGAIGAAVAVAMLAEIRGLIEAPLRLLV